MKYCPNESCPHYKRTGSFAEYNSSIVVCADCDTSLLNGPPPEEEEIKQEVYYDSPLVVIQSFTDPSMAHLAKSQLESVGIPVFLRDEQIASVQWLYSQAVGGVKLEVPESRAREAYEFLFGEIDEPESQSVVEKQQENKYLSGENCPKCGSDKITLNNTKTKSRTLSLLIGIPFSFGKNKYLCKFCENKW